jgi:uncharacterized membrane protein
MEDSAMLLSLNIFQIAAVLLTGLVAGLFYGYDCSVIKGLGNLPDREYLKAFQSINKAILNPYFFVSFLGSILVLTITTWMAYKGPSPGTFYILLAATLTYGIAVFGVTFFGNVPLNNVVAKFDVNTATDSEIGDMRSKFEMEWNMLHHIRTYAATLAFLLTIISMV